MELVQSGGQLLGAGVQRRRSLRQLLLALRQLLAAFRYCCTRCNQLLHGRICRKLLIGLCERLKALRHALRAFGHFDAACTGSFKSRFKLLAAFHDRLCSGLQLRAALNGRFRTGLQLL
ncbi:hypothetical protein D3C71_1467500 [compost metagenome]